MCVVPFVTLAHLETRRNIVSALNYGKMLQKLSNVWSSFWGADNGKNTHFLMVFQVQKQWDICWRCQCSGHPSTSKTEENLDQVTELLHANIRITIREVIIRWEVGVFWKTICTCVRLLTNSCLAAKRGAGELCQHVPGPSMKASKGPRIPFKDNHRWWDVGS
jgi:hypothetical protein